MIENTLLNSYHTQLENLKQVVEESRLRSIMEPPDILFSNHQNVFIKSYLVSACSILEAFIQELANEYVSHLQTKLTEANLPFNFVSWAIDYDKAKQEFKPFLCAKGKKEISDMISPNFWRTMKTFERIGVDLTNSKSNDYKDFITTTVEKRNKIVHENNDALDLSYQDIINTIVNFKEYSMYIFETVSNDGHIK